MATPRTLPRQSLALLGFILLTFCAPLLGAFSTPGEWYAGLNKPSWNPPSWVFGPVWTALYLMMAFAAWLVWRNDSWKRPLYIWLIQLGLNAAWTPLFFGARQPGWALLNILLLWTAILLTILAFRRVSKPAAILLTPYLAWVSFATFLNFTLWRLNPG